MTRRWSRSRRRPKAGEDTLLGHAWPGVIEKHIEHWATRADAREYANDDIVYTRALDKHFGCPPPGTTTRRWPAWSPSSAGMASRSTRPAWGNCSPRPRRWSPRPVNINKPGEVRAYITAAMDATEAIVLEESTKKANLEAISKTGRSQAGALRPLRRHAGLRPLRRHRRPAAGQASGRRSGPRTILDVKIAAKEVELYKKLLLAGKFHASFVVIGTLSSRMAGADGLNPQGIKHAKDVRQMFPLFWEDMILCGGDFDSFEVTIADAVYNDPALRKDLITKGPCPKCGGTGMDKKTGKPCGECEITGMTPQKLHALFGMALSGLTTPRSSLRRTRENDWYDKGKRGVFALVYGGDWNTLVQKLGVTEERAKRAYADFVKRYPGIGKARNKTFDAFCSMRQPAGIGSAVVWADARRVHRNLPGLPPLLHPGKQNLQGPLRPGPQPAEALAALQGQGRAPRPRADGRRGRGQSPSTGPRSRCRPPTCGRRPTTRFRVPGAEITKSVQRQLWDLQPAGIHPLRLAPLNVHDELMVVAMPEFVTDITASVREVVEVFRGQVPLIGMTWFEGMDNWAEKKGGAAPVKIRASEMM